MKTIADLNHPNQKLLKDNDLQNKVLPSEPVRSYRPCEFAKSKKLYELDGKTVEAVRISHCIEGAEYLLKRGIEKESWELFDIRYIVSDFLRDYVMIPIYEGNELKMIVTRDTTGNAPKKYYNIGNVHLFNFENAFERSLEKNIPVFVVEGIFDAIILWQAGASAVAVNGNSSILQPRILSKIDKFRQVILFPDIEENPMTLKQFAKAGKLLSNKPILVDSKSIWEKSKAKKKFDITDIYLALYKDKYKFITTIENLVLKYKTDPFYYGGHSSYKGRKKSHYDIEPVAYTYLNVTGTFGRGLKAYCPWHDDSDPSLRIYLDTGTYYCFGCGAYGDAITLIAKMENVSRKKAKAIYEEMFGKKEEKQ